MKKNKLKRKIKKLKEELEVLYYLDVEKNPPPFGLFCFIQFGYEQRYVKYTKRGFVDEKKGSTFGNITKWALIPNFKTKSK